MTLKLVAGLRQDGLGVGRRVVRYLRSLALLLFVALLPVTLVATNVRFAANEGRLYEYGFDKYNVEARTGLPREEISRAGRELRSYFNNNQKTIHILVEEGGHEVSLFNDRETAHLRDVKHLFQMTFGLQELGVAYVFTYVVGVFIWAREGSLRRLATQILVGSLIAIAAIMALGMVALLGFDRAFEEFHFIAFSNDLWRLDPRTDHLIQMFPQGFWFDASMLVGLLTLAEAAFLALCSGLYLGLTRRRLTVVLTPSQQHA
jgi:integral membrane protein (TIGR01906 family)